MNIQEAIAAGKKKHQEYIVKKVKRISDNMKYSDAPKLSVTNLFTLIDTYCDFYGLKTQHRITARLKGQISQWIKSWESPLTEVTTIDEYVKLLLQQWGDYCGSQYNYAGIPANVFNISLLLDRPKLMASVNMFLERETTSKLVEVKELTVDGIPQKQKEEAKFKVKIIDI